MDTQTLIFRLEEKQRARKDAAIREKHDAAAKEYQYYAIRMIDSARLKQQLHDEEAIEAARRAEFDKEAKDWFTMTKVAERGIAARAARENSIEIQPIVDVVKQPAKRKKPILTKVAILASILIAGAVAKAILSGWIVI